HVTGVQTCALPICLITAHLLSFHPSTPDLRPGSVCTGCSLTPGASPGIKPGDPPRGSSPGDYSQTNGVSERVRTSSCSFATKSAMDSTVCLFPAPRPRTATEPASASRCPTTAM